MIPPLLWLSGCARPDPTPPTLVDTPDIVVEPAGALDLGTVLIPCDQGRELQIVNRGATTRLVDDVHLERADGLVLTVDLKQPLVLHPGGSLPLTLVAVAETPVALDAALVVHSDEGTLNEPIVGQVVYQEQRTESFVAPPPPVDVVVAVDHGAGMTAYQAEWRAGVPGLIDALDAAADWRLILVTGDDACANGPIFTPETAADAKGQLADHAFDTGGGSAFTHALLELASKALAENATDECNREFERDDTPLMVIAMSDIPDDSQFDWAHWVGDYQAYAERVTVSGVVDEHHDCGGGSGGYRDAIDATAGRDVDLCHAGWGGDLAKLADAVQQVEPQVVLAAPPVEDTVQVTVDGDATPAHLADDGRTVVLDQVVPAGAEIRVDYAVDPGCG